MAHIRQHGPTFTFSLLNFETFKLFTYMYSNFFYNESKFPWIFYDIFSSSFLINFVEFDKKVG
jgi:hypothetical protein